MRLVLRRGTVIEVQRAPGDEGEQQVVVVVDQVRRPAVADVGLVGRCEVGDDVVVNVQAVELALGSGGADLVHVNLTRGLRGSGVPGAHVMKLNYSSLQHAVVPVEEDLGDQEPIDDGWVGNAPLDAPGAASVAVPGGGDPGRPRAHTARVGVFGLHGQLAPIAWAVAQAARGLRVGYVQTGGGALPGSHSRVVGELLDRGLLVAHLTAGPAYGGRDGEAITTIGGIDHAVRRLGWDVVLCGPGPGILGSASRLGHGGMAALDSAHAALALSHDVVLCARMSAGDTRERHRGLSHHTQTVADLLLASVTIPLPADTWTPERAGRHAWPSLAVDVPGYAASGLPTRTMGRTLHEDPIFFAAALACGGQLASGR